VARHEFKTLDFHQLGLDAAPCEEATEIIAIAGEDAVVGRNDEHEMCVHDVVRLGRGLKLACTLAVVGAEGAHADAERASIRASRDWTSPNPIRPHAVRPTSHATRTESQ
jgi:hypothetical protein